MYYFMNCIDYMTNLESEVESIFYVFLKPR